MLMLSSLRNSIFAVMVLVTCTCMSSVLAFHSFHRHSSQILHGFPQSKASIYSLKSMRDVKSNDVVLGLSTEQLLSVPQNQYFSSVVFPAIGMKFIHLAFPKAVNAAGKEVPFRGWDIYGRVPFDEFLFSNDKLLDPNFLRKSFVEAVTTELPIAYSTFRRKKFIGEIVTVITRASLGLAGISVLGFFFFFFRNQRARFREREIELMGYTSPTSARYKNRDYTGRKIDSVHGYVDMSRGFNVEEHEETETPRRMRKASDDQGHDKTQRKNRNDKRKQNEGGKSDNEEEDNESNEEN